MIEGLVKIWRLPKKLVFREKFTILNLFNNSGLKYQNNYQNFYYFDYYIVNISKKVV